VFSLMCRVLGEFLNARVICEKQIIVFYLFLKRSCYNTLNMLQYTEQLNVSILDYAAV